MRRVLKADVFLALMAMGILVMAGMGLHARLAARAMRPAHEARAALVRALTLTDLCLVTDARYARHLSVADVHSAFQDHPMALEHFPSGSFIGPPAHLRAYGIR